MKLDDARCISALFYPGVTEKCLIDVNPLGSYYVKCFVVHFLTY